MNRPSSNKRPRTLTAGVLTGLGLLCAAGIAHAQPCEEPAKVPSAEPTAESVAVARETAECWRTRLAVKEKEYELAQGARASAEAALAANPESQTGGKDVIRSATKLATVARELQEARNKAPHAAEAQEAEANAYDLSRRFSTGFGISAGASHAVGGPSISLYSLRLITRLKDADSNRDQIEAIIGFGRFSGETSATDPGDTTYMKTLGLRLNHGRQALAFSWGLALGVLRDDLGLGGEPKNYGVLGELGLALRTFQASDRGFLDGRLYARPWFPFDGSQATVLFGVEVGFGGGLTYSSRTGAGQAAAQPAK